MANLPHITAILAMSADGKISTESAKPARFSSPQDLAHLEEQISLCDAIIFGANTLRAYGTTLTIKQPHLLAQRQERQQNPQPINIVCSASGNLETHYSFFEQPVKRILLTTQKGKENWNININRNDKKILFNDYLIIENKNKKIDWQPVFKHLKSININRVAVLGGGELIASILEKKLIDDLWLTVCPVILGGNQAPSPVGGNSFPQSIPLHLKRVKQVGEELFLNYQIIKN
ncbi:bifunctional deaminase-reductase domain protein [Cyanobacterium stanieri PCC 7202]|uniref:Bifunctional deaminase-reductase domain protein n=1 Tax=Cyanobacterium stanieri (strain ATCC 29140 / PCC 7202) TaxID=292563 RepID=K9YQ95_CYASC|nr:bifunctional deaminase-reductase domain protein [Cyanobacterium stanieri PCC 7202]